MNIRILLISLLFLSCKNEKPKFVVISKDPFIEYSKVGKNVLIYHSDFKLGKANDLNKEGLKLVRKNNLTEAREKFISALSIEPNNPVILNNLGNLEFEDFKFEKTIEYCKKALIASDSTYILAGNNLGRAYGLIGEDQKSEDIYNFIISKTEINFLKGITYYNLADMYLDYGEIDKSFSALYQAKSLLSEFSDFKEELDELEHNLKHYYD